MEILRFYKEGKRWYADIPSWTGKKSSLQMVMGADKLLNRIGNGREELFVHFSEEPIDNGGVLIKRKENWWSGATYKVKKYRDEVLKQKVWLCNVTLHVFNKFPDKIYFNEIEYKE